MIRRWLSGLLALALTAFATSGVSAQDETRLLRFPHINGDRVVFTYAGDLYTASLAGGQATRLTSHEGLEIFARFSPNGEWIAFSGEYAGTRQVYLIPSTGGEPRQLTFYPDVGAMPPRGGYDHLVLDWTPDGEKILIRANRTPIGQRVGRYYLVDPWNGGLETPLEIPEGASGATYDASGQRLAYNIKSREWRHWKRYDGGRQQDVWTYDLANHTSERLTEFTGTDNFPLWVGERIYFVSDRDENRRLNLWVHDLQTGERTQVTEHEDFDVLWPTRGVGGIVYQNGGYIYHLDPATNQSRRLSISVPGDRPHTMPRMMNASERIESFDISPSGKRAVFGARGEIFTVPAEFGNTRNISATPSQRERAVAWSPDGATIAFLSDASGDYDLYVMPADRSAAPRRLVSSPNRWIQSMAWSPDSRSIAFSDNSNALQIVNVETGRTAMVDSTTTGGLDDFTWSPDSRWVAYSRTAENTISSIWVFDSESGRRSQITGDTTDEGNPAFDPAGRYLYFVSARDFDFQFGGGSGFDARIYLTTLTGDEPHPFPFRSDEEPGASNGEDPPESAPRNGGGQEAGEAGDGPAPVRIDLDGIRERIVALPELDPGNYFGLVGTDDGVLFFSGGAVHTYSLESREASEVVRGVNGFALTPDRSRMLYRQGGGNFGIIPVRPGQQNDAGRLDLDGMTMMVDPSVEWAQIYHDAWVIMRDWFYDPDLHGVDWESIRDLYEPLVEHVAHRADLDFLLAELVAEMNAGHAYVNSSPEMPGPERVDIGLLGAEFEADGDHYRISTIFKGENWHEEYRSPLTEPGVEVNEGDYLIAIDGEPVTTDDNPYAYLVGKADRIVEVTVNSRPSSDGARSYQVRPVRSELGLRYQTWVARNAALVDSLSNGRIGYIHLPNTGVPGHRELYEGFRPQHRKEALIFDDRYNGGGFIPEGMAFMVGAPQLNLWARRNLDLYTQPAVVHRGPKAVLINGQSSSGGDAFPYYFKTLGLGALVGERTWGGLVGISGNPGFVDGGGMSVPRFAFVDNEGNWAVEGEGVWPDIPVLDRPEEIAAGREPIIEAAIRHLLEELEKPQYQRPPWPAGPVRTGGSRSGGGN